MASPAVSPACTIVINVFDGRRQPMPGGVDVLYTLIDGNQKQFRNERASSSLRLTVPWFNNFGDNYSVLAYSDKYNQAGFFPVAASPDCRRNVDLMLLGKDADFDFPRTMRW
jgi:hypothetical protein